MAGNVTVTVSGPVFDGRAQAALTAFGRDAEQEVAREGAVRVRANLAGVLRSPTGHYVSRVRAERNEVTDSNVVYGPWLEGVGSRNATSRFKGYFTFRKTTAQLQRVAGTIAQRRLPGYLRRMNG